MEIWRCQNKEALKWVQELADSVREELEGTSLYLVGMMGRLAPLPYSLIGLHLPMLKAY